MIKRFFLNGLSDVAVSTAGVASIPRIPMGHIYKGFIVILQAGIVAADIEYVRVRLGGNLIIDLKGSELDTLNQYMGLKKDATRLHIPFGDPTALTPEGQRFGEIDTRNVEYSGFSLDIKLDGTQTAKILGVVAETDSRNKPDAAGGIPTKAMFRALVRSDYTFGGSGQVDIDVPMGADVGTVIRGIHHFDASGILSEFGLRKDTDEVQELMPISYLQFTQDEVTRVVQSNHFCFDTMPNGEAGLGIDTRTYENGRPVRKASMRLINKVSGAGSIGYVTDMLGTIASV